MRGPVEVRVDLWLKPPKTAVGLPRPLRGADADNLAKPVLDVCTKCGYWGDDAQVCRLTVDKRYCLDTPRAEVAIRELREDA